MKAPCICRWRWGSPCATETHPRAMTKALVFKERGVRIYYIDTCSQLGRWLFETCTFWKNSDPEFHHHYTKVKPKSLHIFGFCFFFVQREDVETSSQCHLSLFYVDGLDQWPVISDKLRAVWSVAWIIFIIIIIMVWLLHNKWKFLRCPNKDRCANPMFLCLKWWCLCRFYFMHFCTESIEVKSFVQLCLHFVHMSWCRCHRLKYSVCR